MRLSLVARNALPWGSRKLRAKPSLTRTSSPIWPSLATRSSRMTCMGPPSEDGRRGTDDRGRKNRARARRPPSSVVRLLNHVGQQSEKPGALDGARKLALLERRHRSDTARHDLAALRDIALQQPHVLVVDLRRVGARKRAGLASAEEGTARSAAGSAFMEAHGSVLRRFRLVAIASVLARAARAVTVAPPVAAALVAIAVAVGLAHHRRRTGLVLVHPHRNGAQHILADVLLPFDLDEGRRRRLDIHQSEMRLAVLADAIGQR